MEVHKTVLPSLKNHTAVGVLLSTVKATDFGGKQKGIKKLAQKICLLQPLHASTSPLPFMSLCLLEPGLGHIALFPCFALQGYPAMVG